MQWDTACQESDTDNGSVSCSVISDSVTPGTIALQAPLSMGFSRPEYWSGLPFAPPGDFPEPGTEPRSPAFQADSLPSGPPGKPIVQIIPVFNAQEELLLKRASHRP